MKNSKVVNNNIPFLLSPSRNNDKKNNKLNTIILSSPKKNIFDFSFNNLSNDAQHSNQENNKISDNKILFLKKIDMKDLTNKKYLEGIKNIFNDKKSYFNKYYKNLKIVVGKSQNKSQTNLIQKKERKNSPKKQSSLNRKRDKNLSNTSIFSDSIKHNTKFRRGGIWKLEDNYISDDDLASIYQKFKEKEKSNENKKIKRNLKFSNIKDYKKKEFYGILNLQNLILNKKEERKIEMDEMEKRLLMNTMKSKDELLINQINEYRIKKEEIYEKENKKNNLNKNYRKTPNLKLNINNADKNLLWLTSLREYENNKENKIRTKRPNLMKKRCFSSNKILQKDETKSFYSFDKKEAFFNLTDKLNSNIYPRLIPLKLKENEKIRDTLNQVNFISRNTARNKFKDKDDNKKFYKTNINMFNGLNIQGKKLIDVEIELSKYLEGKRKKIIQFSYGEDDIKSKIFAQSSIDNNIDIPQTVKNTAQLHFN